MDRSSHAAGSACSGTRRATTVPHGTTDDPGRWTPDLGVVPDRRFTWTGLGGATSAPERTGGAPGPEEASVTWVWALLAVWLVGVPVAVVIGRSIRLADQHAGGAHPCG